MLVLGMLGVAVLASGCGSDSDSDSGSSAKAGFECPNGGTVRMAVEPYEAAAELIPAYEPIAKQLGDKLGCEVKLQITQNYTAEIEAMRAGKLEIGQFGPFGYILAHQLAKAEAVATFADKSGKPGTYYASIVAPKDKGLKSVEDVKGREMAYSDPASTSGFLFPAFLLEKAGIDHKKGVKPVFAGSHTSAYEALRNGKVDAGELNSQEIERAKRVGVWKEGAFVTLVKSDPIPLDPIAVRGDLPQAFKDKLEEALLSLDFKALPEKARAVLIGESLVKVEDSKYDLIRDVQKTLGLGIEDLDT
jgi:phosphonate transport system substrate-binding protein